MTREGGGGGQDRGQVEPLAEHDSINVPAVTAELSEVARDADNLQEHREDNHSKQSQGENVLDVDEYIGVKDPSQTSDATSVDEGGEIIAPTSSQGDEVVGDSREEEEGEDLEPARIWGASIAGPGWETPRASDHEEEEHASEDEQDGNGNAVAKDADSVIPESRDQEDIAGVCVRTSNIAASALRDHTQPSSATPRTRNKVSLSPPTDAVELAPATVTAVKPRFNLSKRISPSYTGTHQAPAVARRELADEREEELRSGDNKLGGELATSEQRRKVGLSGSEEATPTEHCGVDDGPRLSFARPLKIRAASPSCQATMEAAAQSPQVIADDELKELHFGEEQDDNEDEDRERMQAEGNGNLFDGFQQPRTVTVTTPTDGRSGGSEFNDSQSGLEQRSATTPPQQHRSDGTTPRQWSISDTAQGGKGRRAGALLAGLQAKQAQVEEKIAELQAQILSALGDDAALLDAGQIEEINIRVEKLIQMRGQIVIAISNQEALSPPSAPRQHVLQNRPSEVQDHWIASPSPQRVPLGEAWGARQDMRRGVHEDLHGSGAMGRSAGAPSRRLHANMPRDRENSAHVSTPP